VELQQSGAYAEAERLYRQILEAAPENVNAWNMLGLIAQAKGLHEQATDCFYRALKGAPQHFPLYFNLAISYGALGKYAEATEAYRKVLTLNPQIKEAHTGLGNIYWQKGDLAAARAAYEQALKIDADDITAQVNLAEINNDTTALEQLAPTSADAAYYLARRALQNNDFTAAVSYLRQADKMLETPEIKALLGEALENNGQKKEALTVYYQALALQNDDKVMTHIADIEAENGDFATAEKMYHRAIELNPQNLSAHTNLANLLCAKNRTVEALEEYRQAVLIAPNTPEISYNLALVLKSVQEYEQALELMFHAFYSAPQHDDWALNIAETLTEFAAAEPEKARTIAGNWYQKMPEHTVAKHIYAVLNGKADADEIAYNRLLFNTFASSYEQTLQKIDYTVAAQIAELYAPLQGKILDLGCGTGLLGQELKTPQNQLIGVDISPQMLDLARQKSVYDELVEDDIIHYLQTYKKELPQTIVAADVFCYFGDLAPLFKLCAPHKLIFSVETDDNIADFAVQANGRYKHNPQWVENKLHAIGYRNITTTPLVLRRENGIEVQGAIFMAKR
jgi:predicted TPR repeat methyltransferase